LTDKHTYPPGHEPGTHWATDIAWKGLDLIKPGLIPEGARYLLAGYFAAALTTAAKDGVLKPDVDITPIIKP
jgi:hypothetical protein